MDRLAARILIDQLSRDLPAGDSPEADDFDYGWHRERVEAIAARCRPEDRQFVWQWALWHLDAAGLLPEEVTPRYEA